MTSYRKMSLLLPSPSVLMVSTLISTKLNNKLSCFLASYDLIMLIPTYPGLSTPPPLCVCGQQV